MSLITAPLRAELMRAYAAPGRHYHGLAHIEALLGLAQQHAAAIADRDAVEAAIRFHDAIYDARRKDNEERSAQSAAYTTFCMWARVETLTPGLRRSFIPWFC